MSEAPFIRLYLDEDVFKGVAPARRGAVVSRIGARLVEPEDAAGSAIGAYVQMLRATAHHERRFGPRKGREFANSRVLRDPNPLRLSPFLNRRGWRFNSGLSYNARG